jgi:hypothetical protein
MKKIAILSITGFLFGAAAIGQPQSPDNETTPAETRKEAKSEKIALRKMEDKDVAYASIEAFGIDFPNATDVSWRRYESFDEATYTDKDGLKFTAYYDADGKLVGTTHYVNFADVPVKGQKDIEKHYKDYTVGKVVFFDDNEANESDMVLWEIPFDDKDNYFVELTKANNNIILKVDTDGAVSFFKQL